MKNMEQFDASGEIDELLKSDKSPDKLEKKSREILSKQLHDYIIAELQKELSTSRDPVNDVELTDITKLSEKDVEDNFFKFKKQIENEKRLEFVSELAKEFPEAKFYIVGGMVRDALIGKKSKDIDMVICGIARDQLEKAFEKYGKIDLVGRNFGVYKLWFEKIFTPDVQQQEIDIAMPRMEKTGGSGSKRDFEVKADEKYTIEDDLARRDLTVNAMAYDIIGGKLIDPFGGKKDLIGEKIKSVNNPDERFKEDYSRILRAMRFALKLNAKIEENTWRSMCDNFSNMVKIFVDKNGKEKQIIPWETIGSEIKKMFIINPVRALDLLDKSGGLKYIFPEIEELKKFQQPKEHHPEGDVFTHTRLVLKALPENSSLTLVFAGLLHDVGKGITQKIDPVSGKITFYEHAQKGAELARKICERLKFTNLDTEKIVLLVEKHMQIHEIQKMKLSKIYKLLMEELPQELIRLGKADVLACLSDETGEINYATEKIKEFAAKKEEIKPLIMGRDLIELGLKPGKMFKQILNRLFEIQIEEKINEKEILLIKAEEIIKEFIRN